MTEALLRLQHIEFEGAGLYRRSSGELPLAKQGRVLVCGPEGSGKSIIPEVATLILYGKGAPRVKETSFKESSIVNKDTGYLGTLAFDSGFGASARSVSIEQAFKHKRAGSRYVITIDGARDETTGKLEQRKLVKRLAPLSFDEWLGVVYLHQGGMHDLLAGSPAEKQKYLTSVFGLDFYIDLITEAKEEMKRLAKFAEGALYFQQRKATLEEEMREVNHTLAELPPMEDIESGIAKMSSRLQTTAKELGRLEAIKTTAAKRARLKAEYDAFIKKHEWETKVEIQATLDDTKAELRKVGIERANVEAALQRHTDASSAYERIKGKYDLAKHTYEALLEDAAEVPVEGVPPPEVLVKVSKLLDKADRYGIDDLANPKGKAPASLDDSAMAYRESETRLGTVRKLVGHTGPDHRCPTCTRPLSNDEVTKLVDEITKQRDLSYQGAVKSLYHALKEALGTISLPLVDTTEELAAWVEGHRRTIESAWNAKAKLEAAKQRLDVATDAMKTVQEPKDPGDLASKLKELDEWIDGYENGIEAAQYALNLLSQLDALADTAVEGGIDERIEELRSKKVKLDKKYHASLDLKRDRDQSEATLNSLKKQYAENNQKLQKHADNVLRMKEYEAVILPYFSTLRAAKVTSCVGVLEQVLPVYVSAIASDQYIGSECRLVVSDDLETVDLLLKPSRYGSKLSALQASSGQRQRFTLAIQGALYEVSPRKANILWYDEPFGHMESEGKTLVVNRLIPMMLERCETLESVFVIAHDKEILETANDNFDSVWTVELDEGGSRVNIGQRLALVAGR